MEGDADAFAVTRLGASPDPTGWVDGAPTNGIGQSCVLCGTRKVTWVHPLARNLVTYRVAGKGHTLPGFWPLCDRCEAIYTSGDDDAAVEVMRSSGRWPCEHDADVAACIRKPLEVFRRADLGARRFDPEPPALMEAREHGFVPLRELTGVADTLGPLWPPAHRLWLEELGPSPGDDELDQVVDRWLVRSPWPALSVQQTMAALWRWVERAPHPDADETMNFRILDVFSWSESEAVAFANSES